MLASSCGIPRRLVASNFISIKKNCLQYSSLPIFRKHLIADSTRKELKIFERSSRYITPVVSGTSIEASTHVSNRTMSGDSNKPKNLNYEDILEAQKKDEILIIDVREDDEIRETGKLPGSIHIPMGEVAHVLTTVSSQDFKDKYSHEKPSQDTQIILSCRSGKRSAMVQADLEKLGYKNAYNYAGGWLDWESHQNA
ncbi:hypothetical protein TKK_0016228 [Trichogramma kaykai]|uniref:Rhodanese domain-containing protein n=1 Tax=Trichogramma kaykai TaxID=54128 RepID=A0ABD2W7K8_9HYME